MDLGMTEKVRRAADIQGECQNQTYVPSAGVTFEERVGLKWNYQQEH